MYIPTIEEKYEYRITNIVKELLKNIDRDEGFSSGEQLLDFLFQEAHHLGSLLVDDMSQWMEEDDWLELIREG